MADNTTYKAFEDQITKKSHKKNLKSSFKSDMSGGTKKMKGSVSLNQFDLEDDSPEIKSSKFKKDKKILYQK